MTPSPPAISRPSWKAAPPAHGLRLGHLAAAATLGTREDVPTDLTRTALDPHLTLDPATWSTLRLP